MSAITEYVHYYQSNYDEWGINRINTIKSSSLQDSFTQMKNRLAGEQSLSELQFLLMEAKELQKDYNNLFFPQKETDFSRILSEVAQETLEEQFGAAAGRFNSSSLNVERTAASSQYKNKIKAVKQKIQIANLKETASTNQILSRIQQLADVLLNLQDVKNGTLLRNRIEIAKNQLNQIERKIRTENNLQTLDFSADIQTINKLIQEFNRSFTWYNQRGDLFEWLLPLIQLKSTSLAGSELKNAMKQLIGTGNVGDTTISIEFPDFLNMSEENLSTSIDSKKFKMKVADVRSKTDVIINYATGNNQYKQIPISAKSVTGKSVKLVDSTSLYRILIFSENYDFIKHYLNIISWSSKGGQAPNSQILEANRLVKGLIIQLGAQGFDLNNPSQLLIMHSVKEKKIHVYNIKALVYLIQSQIMNANSKYNNIIQSSEFSDNFSIQQPFQSTVEERLNYLFNKINNVKITAHIRGTQLNDYLTLLS